MLINQSNLQELLARLNFFNALTVEPDEMILIGIRGAKSNPYLIECDSLDITEQNLEPDKWRCVIIQSYIHKYNDKLVAFEATTMPGVPYVEDPVNEKGAARLVPGLWTFKRGLHKGNEALVQNEKMVLLRDTDKEYDFDWDTDYLQVGFFGINNHAGGGLKVGKWSAGCSVIRGEYINGVSKSWTSKPWILYKSRAYSSINKIYNYILIPYGWLEKCIEDSTQFCLWGSTGEGVKKIQRKLNLKVDGVYGEFVMREVMKFQKTQGIQTNGMVGPQTSAALFK